MFRQRQHPDEMPLNFPLKKKFCFRNTGAFLQTACHLAGSSARWPREEACTAGLFAGRVCSQADSDHVPVDPGPGRLPGTATACWPLSRCPRADSEMCLGAGTVLPGVGFGISPSLGHG